MNFYESPDYDYIYNELNNYKEQILPLIERKGTVNNLDWNRLKIKTKYNQSDQSNSSEIIKQL